MPRRSRSRKWFVLLVIFLPFIVFIVWGGVNLYLLTNPLAATRFAAHFHPDDPHAALEYGEKLMEDATGNAFGQVKVPQVHEAIYEFKRTLGMVSSPKAHLGMGKALYHTNDFIGAERELRIVLQINPKQAEAHYGLGNIYVRAGQLSRALEEYRAANSLMPNNWDFSTALGTTCEKQGDQLLAKGDNGGAVKVYQEAEGLNHDDAGLHLNLGNALNAVGKRNEARDEWTQVQEYNDFTATQTAQQMLQKYPEAKKGRR
jgi:Flp pilus assembly protein TadD